MARLMVTGGAGFIGSNNVFHHLAASSDEVVVYDALTYAGCRETLDPLKDNPRLHFVHADILDRAAIDRTIEEYGIDTIVHFAAESHVDRSIAAPDAFIRTNIGGTFNLLEAARKYFIQRGSGHFHHVSTDEVYGTLAPEDPAFTEDTPYRPNSPYAASKAGSDHLVRAYVKTYGLEATLPNCSNNYGPRPFPEKLIPFAISVLLDGGKVPVYGDGKQVRDWLYVEDHCRAIDLAIASGIRGGCWNIGGRTELNNLTVIRTICDELDAAFNRDESLAERFPKAPPVQGKSCRDFIEHVTDRPGHDRRYAINPTRAERELGFAPAYNFADGIRSTVAWYLDHEQWWRALQGRIIDFRRRKI